MTVSGTTTSLAFTGNGSTTTFAVSFPFLGTGSAAELTVVERTIATGVEVTKSYTTHYTVTGGNGSTGAVVAGTAPADTVQWHIRRNTTTTQTSDYVANDPFSADTIENNLDRLAMAGQERDKDISQSFKFADTYTGGASTTFPEPVAGAFVTFNSAGDALTTSTDSAAQWLGGNGTASLPYYSFSADPNSGFYRIGADNVGLTLGGTKKVDFGAATTAFTGEVTATGFTGTLDGSLGSGTPAAAVVTQLTSGGVVVSDTDSTDDLGTTGVRWREIFVDAVTATDNATIGGNLTVTGNLTINGTTVTNDAVNLEVKDPLIELNSGASSNANDLGLVMERGSTGNNAFMGWDESADKFAFGTTTATGSSTGNISYADAQVLAEGATFSGTSPDLGTVTTIDINGGTIDATNIGASTAGTGAFSTITAATSLALATGSTVTGILDEDAMGTNSATQLATQQSIKAYVDSNLTAAGIQMTWETATTDTDQGVGKVFANNATLSSATVLYFDDVERNGVSINSFIDSLDDPTATNSATIYISEGGTGGAGVVFQVSGAVTSASTYSKVAVTHVATYGTLSDGDLIGVVIAFSGNNGSIDEIADDSSPQLGGDLDCNGNDITSASNADVDINPNGTGNVVLKTDLVSVGGGSEVGHVSSNGANDMKISSNSGTNSGTIIITDAANGAITLAPNGTGIVDVQGSMNSSISSTGKALVFGF